MNSTQGVTGMVFKALSDNLQAAIDTGNESWARTLVTTAQGATITTAHWHELRQDFETAFGDY
jgi:hypothetical protein